MTEERRYYELGPSARRWAINYNKVTGDIMSEKIVFVLECEGGDNRTLTCHESRERALGFIKQRIDACENMDPRRFRVIEGIDLKLRINYSLFLEDTEVEEVLS